MFFVCFFLSGRSAWHCVTSSSPGSWFPSWFVFPVSCSSRGSSPRSCLLGPISWFLSWFVFPVSWFLAWFLVPLLVSVPWFLVPLLNPGSPRLLWGSSRILSSSRTRGQTWSSCLPSVGLELRIFPVATSPGPGLWMQQCGPWLRLPEEAELTML